MGCGSSNNKPKKQRRQEQQMEVHRYREASEISTTMSSLDQRTDPDGQEMDTERYHDLQHLRLQPRQKPHVEWWAHPPHSPSKDKVKDEDKDTTKNSHKGPQPSSEHQGHTTHDMRKKLIRKDNSDRLLVVDAPLDL